MGEDAEYAIEAAERAMDLAVEKIARRVPVGVPYPADRDRKENLPPLPHPRCPICGHPAHKTETRYGDRYDCCGLRSWNGKPLCDSDTLMARSAAHKAFDPIWRSGLTSRKNAYRMLAAKIGIPEPACHMSFMDKWTAMLVPMVVAEIMEDIDAQNKAQQLQRSQQRVEKARQGGKKNRMGNRKKR